MEFSEVLKKKNAEIQEVNLKRSVISRGDQEKITMWNFHGSSFLGLKFPRGET